MFGNRVIVIEDSEPDRAVIGEVLADYCTEDRIAYFENGSSFEHYLASVATGDASSPTLILVDLHLPDCSGVDLIRSIRSHPYFAAVPIVVLTGIVVSQTITECYEAGANSYCLKAIDMHDYRKNLESLCYNWLHLAVSPHRDI